MYMPESLMCRKVQTQLLLTLSKQKTEQGMLWHWKSDLQCCTGQQDLQEPQQFFRAPFLVEGNVWRITTSDLELLPS